MKISRKTFLRSLLGMAGTAFSFRHVPAAGTETKTLALKNLGKTGLRVTALGLGAARTMEPALVKAALDRGIDFIDTGRSYMNGKNEEMLGRVLRGRRQQVIVQSKIKLPEDGAGKLQSRDLMNHLEVKLNESLEALQTDWIDVMLLHGIEEETILENEAVREFFRRAEASGKIRTCGFSSHNNHLALLEKTLQTDFYEVVMLPFNPFGGFRHSQGGWSTSWDQDGLIRAMERAQAAGIGIVAMKTCSGGPFAPGPDVKPSLAAAVQWVTAKPYIAGTAVAMGNFTELEEHLSRHGS